LIKIIYIIGSKSYILSNIFLVFFTTVASNLQKYVE